MLAGRRRRRVISSPSASEGGERSSRCCGGVARAVASALAGGLARGPLSSRVTRVPSFCSSFSAAEQQRGCCSECVRVCGSLCATGIDASPLLARTPAEEDFIRLLHFWQRLPRRNRSATSAVRTASQPRCCCGRSFVTYAVLNLAQVGSRRGGTPERRVFLSPGSAKDPCHAVTLSLMLQPVLASGAGELGVWMHRRLLPVFRTLEERGMSRPRLPPLSRRSVTGSCPLKQSS